jgi:Mg-chelatase subunit ChlD
MTDKNRSDMIYTVDTINPLGATIMEDAIKTAMDLISQRTDASNNASILFFTDGQPTQGLQGQ